MQSFDEQYPELVTIAKEVAIKTIKDINKSSETVTSKMPYKAQAILERTIQFLQEIV